MSRNVFGWDLPPGVTPRMIDEAFGEGDEPCSCDELLDARIHELENQGLSPDDAWNRAEHEQDDGRWCEACERQAQRERLHDAEVDAQIEDRLFGDDD